MAFHRFCKAIIERQPIVIYGDGQQTRDFTYISDVVEANVQAVTSRTAAGEVMNIAGGSRVNLHQVMQYLRDISNAPINVTFDERQHGDVGHTFADTIRAQQHLAYRPQIALRDGLVQEFEYIEALYSTVRSR
jgi:UDP-glucose 4-epimerase